MSNSATILLAENHAQLRGFVHGALRDSGYHVLVAEDGQQALQIAGEYDGEIHVLLADLFMPGMDGTAVAGELQRVRPAMRVIIYSGVDGKGLPLMEGWQFLMKPFSLEELLAVIERALGIRS